MSVFNNTGAVRRNRLLKDSSNSDVEDQIKVWLRQSCDLAGGRRGREKKPPARPEKRPHSPSTTDRPCGKRRRSAPESRRRSPSDCTDVEPDTPYGTDIESDD